MFRDHRDATQPPVFSFRVVDAGYLASSGGGRIGLCKSVPPQLGQHPLSTVSAQVRQKVHSKEQISA